MKKLHQTAFRCLLLTAIVLTVACAGETRDRSSIVAAPVVTDILSASPGYTGDRIGAMVERVNLSDNDYQTIRIEVPLEAEKIDVIDVFDADNQLIEQEQEMQVFPADRNDRSTVEIYLPKGSKFRFQLHLIDLADE